MNITWQLSFQCLLTTLVITFPLPWNLLSAEKRLVTEGEPTCMGGLGWLQAFLS